MTICRNPDCRRPIPPKRLAAVPNALYCVPCQSQRDTPRRPPASVMAVRSEMDDSTRSREVFGIDE